MSAGLLDGTLVAASASYTLKAATRPSTAAPRAASPQKPRGPSTTPTTSQLLSSASYAKAPGAAARGGGADAWWLGQGPELGIGRDLAAKWGTRHKGNIPQSRLRPPVPSKPAPSVQPQKPAPFTRAPTSQDMAMAYLKKLV